jgi:hypothetical protein
LIVLWCQNESILGSKMLGTALSGQTALVPLPSIPAKQKVGEGNDLNSLLPVQLKISETVATRNKGTDSGVLGNGMDVIKIAEVSSKFSH